MRPRTAENATLMGTGAVMAIRIELNPSDRFEHVPESPFAPAFSAMQWHAELTTDATPGGVAKIEEGKGVVLRMGRTVMIMVMVDRPLPHDAPGTTDFAELFQYGTHGD